MIRPVEAFIAGYGTVHLFLLCRKQSCVRRSSLLPMVEATGIVSDDSHPYGEGRAFQLCVSAARQETARTNLSLFRFVAALNPTAAADAAPPATQPRRWKRFAPPVAHGRPTNRG